jgi:hypothetical protein
MTRGNVSWIAKQYRLWRRSELTRLREDRALYADSAGRPILRPSIVLYLDSLGTKERARRLTVNQLRDEISDLDLLQPKLHTDFWRGDRQRFVAFSDNVAVAVPTRLSDVSEEALRQAAACAGFQLQRTLRGRAIRGGIAFGDVFCDGHIIDGPGLVTVVELEEHHADVPRILVDDSIAVPVRNHVGTVSKPWPGQLMIVDGRDGRVVVNYLLLTKPGAGSDTTLARHRSVVVDQLGLHAANPKVLVKWQWVAGYHNWFVQEYRHGEPSLLLDTTPSTFRLL